MKKLICFLIIITVFMPYAVYSDSNTDNTTVVNITLEDALNKLEQNNNQLDLLRGKISIYEKRYKTSLEQAEKSKDKYGYSDQLNIMYQKDVKLNWQLRLLDLQDIQNEYKTLLFDKQIKVKQLYYNLLTMQNDFLIINNEITNIDKKIEDINIKINLGKALNNDKKLLLAQRLALIIQKNELNKQIESSMIDIKKEIGIDIFKKIILKDIDVKYQILDITDILDKIDEAAECQFSIIELNKKLQLKLLEKQITVENTINRDSLDLSSYDMAISELEMQISERKNSISGDLWIEYNNIQNLQDNVLLEELNLEIKKMDYEAALAKVKLGMMNQAMESSARIDYIRQQNSLQRAKISYLIASEQLNYKLGI